MPATVRSQRTHFIATHYLCNLRHNQVEIPCEMAFREKSSKEGGKMGRRRFSTTTTLRQTSCNSDSDQHSVEPMSLPPNLTAITPGSVFKVMLLGDANVGKTCLMIRFSDGHFLSGTYISTVGIDFRHRTLEVDGEKLRVQVWDTAGQERFRSVTRSYFRDAHALLLVYDVTNRASFVNVRAWFEQISQFSGHSSSIMLIGNKCDKTNQRQVLFEEGEKLAVDLEAVFLETSANTGTNVLLAFTAVARQWRYKQSQPDGTSFDVQKYILSRSSRSSCNCG